MDAMLNVVIVVFTIYAAIRIAIVCIKDTKMTKPKTEEPKVVVRNTSTTAQFGSDG